MTGPKKGEGTLDLKLQPLLSLVKFQSLGLLWFIYLINL